MTKLFFTADTHFNHGKMIEYCERPFKNVIDMNDRLIRNWNERVKPDDTVIVVGDFGFNSSSEDKIRGISYSMEYLKRNLNGDIVLLKGNHDTNNKVKTKIKSLSVEFGGYDIFVVHNPEDYNPDYDLNIVGHVHKLWKTKTIDNDALVNVGVDVWNYRPVSMQEILDVIREMKS